MRDDELRDRFQAMRSQDEGDTPTFEATLAAARGRHRERQFDTWSWAALATAAPAIALLALVLGVLDSPATDQMTATVTLEDWSAPTSGLVADLGTPDDPLAALEAFQSPTAGLLDFDDRRTP